MLGGVVLDILLPDLGQRLLGRRALLQRDVELLAVEEFALLVDPGTNTNTHDGVQFESKRGRNGWWLRHGIPNRLYRSRH